MLNLMWQRGQNPARTPHGTARSRLDPAIQKGKRLTEKLDFTSKVWTGQHASRGARQDTRLPQPYNTRLQSVSRVNKASLSVLLIPTSPDVVIPLLQTV